MALTRRHLALLATLASLLALLFWLSGFHGPVCGSLACRVPLDFLGRPWLAWVALFYAVAAALFIVHGKPANIVRSGLLILAVVVHGVLLVCLFQLTGETCPVCVSFAGITASLTVANFMIPREPVGAWSPAWLALPVLIAGLWLVNPSQQLVPVVAQATSTVQAVSLGTRLDVYTPAGQKVTLDLDKQPVLFFAWWCPHCQKVLGELGKLPAADRPVLVDVWYKTGDQENVAKDVGGLGNFYVQPQPPKSIQGVPTLVYALNGQTSEISGDQAIMSYIQEVK